jgi:hypothetical protein
MSTGRWLTPNAPLEHKAYVRKLTIPADIRFLAPISGALSELTYPSAWEKDGDLTPDETAVIFSDIYQKFLSFDNEPPEWETPDELDGTPEQPWYDDLADWIIQGFLAVTFTPLAALTYQATVPRLRVAIRTGNLGALFKVLINGIEVWTGDSYAPITDLIDQVFDMSAETEPYTVRIEHNGIGEGHGLTEAKLEVVRGEAVANMVATILRADPLGCGVQWSTDSGDTWETIDLATCITDLANGAIGTAIDNGLISVPGQQPGKGAPEPGSCVTYKVVLDGKGTWYCPSPVNSNDVITITDFSGAWWDGETFASWHCPDGNPYTFGTCGDSTATHETDPFNTAPHMCLIGRVVSTYFDAIRDGYTVPAGVVNQPLLLQANDAPLSDNAGSIEFTVSICAAAGWTHIFDFTQTDTWLQLSPYNSEWIEDSGWNGQGWTYEADIYGLCGVYTEFEPRTITAVSFTFAIVNGVNDAPPNTTRAFLESDTVPHRIYASTPFADGTHTINCNLLLPVETYLIGFLGQYGYRAGSHADPGGSFILTSATISGLGSDPFA